MAELIRKASRSNSNNIVFILDCCYSGILKWDKVNFAIKGNIEQSNGSFSAIVACNSYEIDCANDKYSFFTKTLLRGLKKNEETVDEFGYVTLKKLESFLIKEINKYKGNGNTQNPKIISGSKDIAITYHPHLAKPEDNYYYEEKKFCSPLPIIRFTRLIVIMGKKEKVKVFVIVVLLVQYFVIYILV